eukprot:4451803-Amphidinium_carterae.1
MTASLSVSAAFTSVARSLSPHSPALLSPAAFTPPVARSSPSCRSSAAFTSVARSTRLSAS